MQRKAHLQAAVAAGDNGGQGLQGGLQVKLYVGVLLYILAAVPDVFAYALAPHVVCTAVACFRLVVVTVLAHIFLNEKIKCQQAMGMLACSVGTFLCVYFGPNSETRKHPDSAENVFQPAVVAYLTLGLIMLFVLILVEHAVCFFNRIAENTTSEDNGYSFVILPLATGLAFGLEKVFNTEIGCMDGPENLPWGLLHAPSTWVLMVVAIAILGCTDFYLNLRGAKKMPVQIFIPCVFTLATSLQYMQSIVIFGEFVHLSTGDKVISIGGAFMSLVGALCISPPQFSCLSLGLSNNTSPTNESPPARELLSDDHCCDSAARRLEGIEIVFNQATGKGAN